MQVFVPDLNEHAASIRQQLTRHEQPVPQVSEIGVDPELPGIAECTHLLRLSRRVLYLPVLYLPLARAHLPIRSELDPVRRIEIDALHLPLEPLLLGQTRHHEQRVAEDHPVRPVSLM